MPSSLKSQTIHALSWSLFGSIGMQGIRFVIGVILARLLFPEQFGLIGMLTIFMTVAQAFIDSGFGMALIQKREITDADICSIFYFNIVVGLLAATLLYLGAPWISDFYHQPILTPITRAMSLVIVINSFGSIQNTILRKHIDFKNLTKRTLIAGILSGIIGVILAYLGFGVWSLVVQQICNALFQTVLIWFLSTWRPSLIFSFNSLQEMFGFGSKMFASGLLTQIFNNMYILIIGKLFSARDLGFYTRADALHAIPLQSLSGVVNQVLFPVFSTIQDAKSRLKRGLRKAITTLILINFPIMIIMAIVARPMIFVLLTEKWSESIPYLQLLCFQGLVFPLNIVNLNLLQAMGRSELFLRLEIIKRTLVVINIAITYRWGISAMIYGMIVNSIISYYLNTYYTAKLIDYSIWEQLSDIWPYLFMSVLMGVIVFIAGLIPFPNYWSMLIVQLIIGTVVYVSLCRIFRLKAFMELWQMILEKTVFINKGSYVN